jgi:hypothetical protein
VELRSIRAAKYGTNSGAEGMIAATRLYKPPDAAESIYPTGKETIYHG